MTNETHLERARRYFGGIPETKGQWHYVAEIAIGAMLAHLEQQVAGASEGICSGYCTAENHASDCPKYAAAPPAVQGESYWHDQADLWHRKYYHVDAEKGALMNELDDLRKTAVQGEERAARQLLSDIWEEGGLQHAASCNQWEHPGGNWSLNEDKTCDCYYAQVESIYLAASSPAVPTESAEVCKRCGGTGRTDDDFFGKQSRICPYCNVHPGPLPAQTEGGERRSPGWKCEHEGASMQACSNAQWSPDGFCCDACCRRCGVQPAQAAPPAPTPPPATECAHVWLDYTPIPDHRMPADGGPERDEVGYVMLQQCCKSKCGDLRFGPKLVPEVQS